MAFVISYVSLYWASFIALPEPLAIFDLVNMLDYPVD